MTTCSGVSPGAGDDECHQQPRGVSGEHTSDGWQERQGQTLPSGAQWPDKRHQEQKHTRNSTEDLVFLIKSTHRAVTVMVLKHQNRLPYRCSGVSIPEDP